MVCTFLFENIVFKYLQAAVSMGMYSKLPSCPFPKTPKPGIWMYRSNRVGIFRGNDVTLVTLRAVACTPSRSMSAVLGKKQF